MNSEALSQKRQLFRVNIRKQFKHRMQAARRAEIIRTIAGKAQREEMLRKIIECHLENVNPETATAVKLFPLLQYMISQPTKDEVVINYVYLLDEEIFMQPTICTAEIVEYMLAFINAVPYRELIKFKGFCVNFLNLASQITWSVKLAEVAKLKKRLLDWCMGTQSLTIINNCLTEFPTVNQYSHIYDIIEHGLERKEKETRQEAARLLTNICKMGDYDDIASLYHTQSGIFTNLMGRMLDANEPQARELYAGALLSLCQTYNQAVCSYAKMGLCDIGCQLVLAETDSQLSIGLKIVKTFAAIASDETSMKDELLRNQSRREMWEKLGGLYRSPNLLDRKNLYSTILFMMDAINYDELVDQFLPQLKTNLMEVLDYGLANEENPDIVYCIIQMIRILLSHSERMKEIHQMNYVAAQISRNGMLARIEQLSCSSQHSKTRDECNAILYGYKHINLQDN